MDDKNSKISKNKKMRNLFLLFFISVKSSNDQPNIIFVISDDLGKAIFFSDFFPYFCPKNFQFYPIFITVQAISPGPRHDKMFLNFS